MLEFILGLLVVALFAVSVELSDLLATRRREQISKYIKGFDEGYNAGFETGRTYEREYKK